MNVSTDLRRYSTLVFDCDGVVLDSNRVKTRAFYEAALPYGEAAAQKLVEYHVSHGGISRYKKFALFLAEMTDGRSGPGLEELLESYATRVRDGLMSCDIAPGLKELRETTPDARWLIVSGGDQAELRDVFAARGIHENFNAGIFGSPDTKNEILARELSQGTITGDALFLGDSKYDHQASTAAGLDFVFVSDWTEVPGWDNWCAGNGIASVRSLRELV